MTGRSSGLHQRACTGRTKTCNRTAKIDRGSGRRRAQASRIRVEVRLAIGEVKIRLLGPPAIEDTAGNSRQPRGRKAWGLLAYLVAQQRATRRIHVATMLFPDAEDPLGALRWNLSELRKALGPEVTLGGDPLFVSMPPKYRCDVYVATGIQEAQGGDFELPDVELLEGLNFTDCPAFETWLAAERHRIRNCVQTLIYETALAALASGEPRRAAELAAKATALDPFNANFHAVLVRALVVAGEQAHARNGPPTRTSMQT